MDDFSNGIGLMLAFLGGPILFVAVVIAAVFFVVRMFRGKSDVKNQVDSTEEKNEKPQSQRNEPINIWPVVIIFVGGLLIAILSSLLD